MRVVVVVVVMIYKEMGWGEKKQDEWDELGVEIRVRIPWSRLKRGANPIS